MKKIEDMEARIMKCIIEHKAINATAVAEEFGIDRHTMVKHYKELTNQIVCLKDIHLDNVRIFGQGVRKFVQLNLYTAL